MLWGQDEDVAFYVFMFTKVGRFTKCSMSGGCFVVHVFSILNIPTVIPKLVYINYSKIFGNSGCIGGKDVVVFQRVNQFSCFFFGSRKCIWVVFVLSHIGIQDTKL